MDTNSGSCDPLKSDDVITNEAPAEQTIESHVIDTDGDLSIRASSKKFLVSSKVLSLASPVLKTLGSAR